MSEIRINVSEDGLREFSNSVESFHKSILFSCQELLNALQKLSYSMDESTISSMAYTVRSICKILDESDPELKQLKTQIDAYADFVAVLKRQAQS